MLKNFPDEAQLRADLAAMAANLNLRQLDNFWMPEFDFTG